MINSNKIGLILISHFGNYFAIVNNAVVNIHISNALLLSLSFP